MSSGNILFPYSSINEPQCLTTQVSSYFRPKVCCVIKQRSRRGSLAQLGRAQAPLQTRLAYILNFKSALFSLPHISKFSKAEREILPNKYRSETSFFLETPSPQGAKLSGRLELLQQARKPRAHTASPPNPSSRGTPCRDESFKVWPNPSHSFAPPGQPLPRKLEQSPRTVLPNSHGTPPGTWN